VKGGHYTAGRYTFDPVETAYGWVRSFDAATGKPGGSWKMPTPMVAGITPTASGVLFTGDLNGDFL
jgi:alcohol dehydrogenase (cytochrome c)